MSFLIVSFEVESLTKHDIAYLFNFYIICWSSICIAVLKFCKIQTNVNSYLNVCIFKAACFFEDFVPIHKVDLKVELVRYRSFAVSLTICSKDLTIVHEDDNSVTRFSSLSKPTDQNYADKLWHTFVQLLRIRLTCPHYDTAVAFRFETESTR